MTPDPSALTAPVATQILDHFAAGQSVNHIVYLLHYQYDTGHVNAAIRERLRELEGENARLKEIGKLERMAQ